MIPQSILNMINDTTKKAYILTALEYIKKECEGHSEEYDENDFPIGCKNCIFCVDDAKNCFFNAGWDGTIPEEWDLSKLKEILEKGD